MFPFFANSSMFEACGGHDVLGIILSYCEPKVSAFLNFHKFELDFCASPTSLSLLECKSSLHTTRLFNRAEAYMRASLEYLLRAEQTAVETHPEQYEGSRSETMFFSELTGFRAKIQDLCKRTLENYEAERHKCMQKLYADRLRNALQEWCLGNDVFNLPSISGNRCGPQNKSSVETNPSDDVSSLNTETKSIRPKDMSKFAEAFTISDQSDHDNMRVFLFHLFHLFPRVSRCEYFADGGKRSGRRYKICILFVSQRTNRTRFFSFSVA
jgi:hypothetical protein